MAGSMKDGVKVQNTWNGRKDIDVRMKNKKETGERKPDAGLVKM